MNHNNSLLLYVCLNFNMYFIFSLQSTLIRVCCFKMWFDFSCYIHCVLFRCFPKKSFLQSHCTLIHRCQLCLVFDCFHISSLGRNRNLILVILNHHVGRRNKKINQWSYRTIPLHRFRLNIKEHRTCCVCLFTQWEPGFSADWRTSLLAVTFSSPDSRLVNHTETELCIVCVCFLATMLCILLHMRTD